MSGAVADQAQLRKIGGQQHLLFFARLKRQDKEDPQRLTSTRRGGF